MDEEIESGFSDFYFARYQENNALIMKVPEKIIELREIIDNALRPLIKGNYVFLDVPYYQNIGDVLIWCGTENYLKSIPFKCLYKTSCTCFIDGKIPHGVTILLQGGGNFGDLWHPHQEFRNEIIKKYPDNPIVILPQTVYYKDENKIKKDAALYKKHTNVTICARDMNSYDLLKNHFINHILLVPDMAFYIDVPPLKNITGRSLFLKRTDLEFKEKDNSTQYLPQDIEVHDWPTYEKNLKAFSFNYIMSKYLMSVDNKLSTNFFKYWNDFFNDVVLRRYCLYIAKKFIGQYDLIYSTRLHPTIMGILLGKEVKFMDNSYGKNLNFYRTWLNDLDNIQMISENDKLSE